MGGIFKVDLAKVEWCLSIPFPSCGDALFPDDLSGRYQSLLRIEMEEGAIEAVIQCNTCGAIIHLEGLEILDCTVQSPTLSLRTAGE